MQMPWIWILHTGRFWASGLLDVSPGFTARRSGDSSQATAGGGAGGKEALRRIGICALSRGVRWSKYESRGRNYWNLTLEQSRSA